MWPLGDGLVIVCVGLFTLTGFMVRGQGSAEGKETSA